MLQPGWIRTLLPSQRELNGGARADVAIPADPDIGADHSACTDHRAGADFDVGTDHGQRIDDHAVFQMRAGIDDGGWCDAGAAEPGLRTKRVAVEARGQSSRIRGTAGPRAARRRGPGHLASKRALTRHAPALVEASWSAYFRLSKNVRCIGPASSSEASPLTCWPPRDASTRCAFVNAAISASVDEGGCSKNVGCAIPPVAVRPVIEPELRF